MSFLGIDRDSGAVYIGKSPSSGYRCQNDPYLTPFRIMRGNEVPPDEIWDITFHMGRSVFREVYFDPVTRVRRGDVFTQSGNQPTQWLAQDPYRKDLGNVSTASQSRYRLDLITYQKDLLATLAKDLGKAGCPRVLLGAGNYSTLWKIINVEASLHHTAILTLKAEQYYGEVPDIFVEKVPESIRQALNTLLDDIGSNVHRLSPVAVVDRCRDCLSLVFGEMAGEPGADLMQAVKAWLAKVKEKENIRSNCGFIVARLHSRGKPNEQRTKQLRPLDESDSQIALRCLWTVLVEFGWAR